MAMNPGIEVSAKCHFLFKINANKNVPLEIMKKIL